MELYNLIQEDMIHTSNLSLESAKEMRQTQRKTSPEVEFWIEPIEYRQ